MALKAANPAFVYLLDRHRVQAIDSLSAIFPHQHKISLAKHFDVLHHADPRQVREVLDNLTGQARPITQQVQNVPARWIG